MEKNGIPYNVVELTDCSLIIVNPEGDKQAVLIVSENSVVDLTEYLLMMKYVIRDHEWRQNLVNMVQNNSSRIDGILWGHDIPDYIETLVKRQIKDEVL